MNKFCKRLTALALAVTTAALSAPADILAKNTSLTNQLENITQSDTIMGDYKEGEAVILYHTDASALGTASAAEAALPDDLIIEESYELDADADSTGASNHSAMPTQDTTISVVSSKSMSTENLVAALSALDYVEYAEPNYIYHALSLDNSNLNTDYSEYLWGLQNRGQNGGTADTAENPTDINVDLAASLPQTASNNPVIAVLDTGIDFTNPTLASHMWVNPYQGQLSGTYGYNFLYMPEFFANEEPLDDNGHGTHCAGIVNSVANTDNDDVKLMALKWLDSDGYGELSDVISAYYYIYTAQKLGVNIVAANNSWGGGDPSDILEKLICLTGEKGCLTIFAAGNDGMDNDTYNSISNMDNDYTLVVAASNEDGELAAFSNYGKEQVDIAAPGTDILSTVQAPVFNPSIYNAAEIEALCSNYVDYNYADYKTMESTLQQTSTPNVSVGLPITAHTDNVSFALADDTFFGSVDAPNQSSLKITFNGTANQSYQFLLPYEVPASSCAEDVSFMLRTESPTMTDDYAGILSIYDIPSSALPEDLRLLSPDAIDSYMTSLMALDGVNNFWDHVVYTNSAGQTAETRYVVFNVTCLSSGSHTLYIDDFGISEQNLPVISNKAYGCYDFYNGTSMACPYVVGSVGLLAQLETYSAMSAADKVNLLRSCYSQKSQFAGKLSTEGSLDLGKLVDSAYQATPLINSIKVSNQNAVIQGANLSGSSVKINNTSCTATASSDGKTLTVPAAAYLNKYVTVTVTKGDKTAAKSCYLVKGKKNPTPLGDSMLYDGAINAITNSEHAMYFLSNSTLYGYDTAPPTDPPYEEDPEEGWEDFPAVGAEDAAESIYIESYGTPYSDIFTDSNVDFSLTYRISLDSQLAYLNQKLYMIANVSQTSNLDQVFYTEKYLVSYEPDLAIWSIVKKLDTSIIGQSLGVYNNTLYLIGGYSYVKKSLLDTVTTYQPLTDSWGTATALPATEKRAGGTIRQVGSKLVYTLGYTSTLSADTNLPASVTVPKTLVYDGRTWSSTGENLTAYNYSSIKLNDTTYYIPAAGVGVCKNGLIYTGLACEGYGDIFSQDLTTGKYAATDYSLIQNLTEDSISGTVLGDTLYTLMLDTAAGCYHIATMPVTSGLVKTTLATSLYNVLCDFEQLLPGTSAAFYTEMAAGYYLNSMTLADADGHTAVMTDGMCTFAPTSDIKVVSASVGRYLTKLTLNQTKINYAYKASAKKHTYTLKAATAPAAASGYTVNNKLSWTSSNKKYATVSAKGVVTFKKAGIGKTVKITASATDGSGLSSTCTIRICRSVTKLTISNAHKAKTLRAGKSMKLTATVSPAKATIKSVTWKSSNTKYATVSAKGKVTAKKAGIGKTVTITATAKDGSKIKATYKIKIKK